MKVRYGAKRKPALPRLQVVTTGGFWVLQLDKIKRHSLSFGILPMADPPAGKNTDVRFPHENPGNP